MEHIGHGVHQVWRDSFNESDSYINFFIEHGFSLGAYITVGPTFAPYGSLHLLPIVFTQNSTSYRGLYLYALGTILTKRGEGYGKQLVNKAKKFAYRTGANFIILQPTDNVLFEYYRKLGFNMPVFRSCLKCTRADLSALYLSRNRLTEYLLPLSTTKEQMKVLGHFAWESFMLNYIKKECLFRGGAVINGAYCYPNTDVDGDFLEIKEFCASIDEIPGMVQLIMATFPSIERFSFYGKIAQSGSTQVPAVQSVFALACFLKPELENAYNPELGYFALGLD